MLQFLDHEQVAPLDAVASVAVEESLSAAEPARGTADLASQREVRADEKGTPHRTLELACLDVEVMSPLQPAHPLVLVPEHVRARSEELDVGRFQRYAFVGLGERLVRIAPRPRLVERAPAR
jgi:hypothetical protein